MRILHFNNEKTWRGGERQTLLLAEELQRRGIVNVIACRRGGLLAERAKADREEKPPLPSPLLGEEREKTPSAKDGGIKVIEVSANSVAAVLELRRAACGFDLVHCHTGRGHSIAAIALAGTGKPFIVTRRVDFEPWHTVFNRWKFRRASKVVCISRFIAEQLERWGVEKTLLDVVPSAVPGSGLRGGTKEVKADLRRLLPRVGEEEKVVGNIAAMVPHKDQATLLRAAQIVRKARGDVVFVIIGEGELRPEIEKLRRELGLEEIVLTPGFVPEAEKLLPAFDVFAMSSCMEGLGSIVLDAFAAGVPVAATAGGGLPELVRDGVTGLLTPIKDFQALAQSILKLLDNRSLCDRLTATASQLVRENFSVQSMADRYLAIYNEVLRNRRSA